MNTLFLVSMFAEGVFALGFLAAPQLLARPFGVTLDSNTAFALRLFGSALFAFPILLWFARQSSQVSFRKSVATAMLAYYFASGLVLLSLQLAALVNFLGWLIIAIHLAFSIGYTYFIVNS